MSKGISRLALNHKDRLLRFGSKLVFRLCKHYGIEVVILEEKAVGFEEELAKDVIESMTVFLFRLYGRRSHQKPMKTDLTLAT